MSTTSELPDFFSLVADAESDMRMVYDHALIVYDYLSSADPLTPDQKSALNWPAGELLDAGRRLREHSDAMYDAAILYRGAARSKSAAGEPAAEGNLFVDPSTLTIDEMFGLYTALGTVGAVMDGLLCQPKFRCRQSLNAAGEMLDRLRDVVSDAAEAIRQEVASRPTDQGDASRQVFFAAEEWVDGSCQPGPALKGLTTALSDLGKAVTK